MSQGEVTPLLLFFYTFRVLEDIVFRSEYFKSYHHHERINADKTHE